MVVFASPLLYSKTLTSRMKLANQVSLVTSFRLAWRHISSLAAQ